MDEALLDIIKFFPPVALMRLIMLVMQTTREASSNILLYCN